MHDWRDKSKTNHLLINKVMEYPKDDLWIYFIKYHDEYGKRYGKTIKQSIYFDGFDVDKESYKYVCPKCGNVQYSKESFPYVINHYKIEGETIR